MPGDRWHVVNAAHQNASALPGVQGKSRQRFPFEASPRALLAIQPGGPNASNRFQTLRPSRSRNYHLKWSGVSCKEYNRRFAVEVLLIHRNRRGEDFSFVCRVLGLLFRDYSIEHICPVDGELHNQVGIISNYAVAEAPRLFLRTFTRFLKTLFKQVIDGFTFHPYSVHIQHPNSKQLLEI
jgi:hypothetical protein